MYEFCYDYWNPKNIWVLILFIREFLYKFKYRGIMYVLLWKITSGVILINKVGGE